MDSEQIEVDKHQYILKEEILPNSVIYMFLTTSLWPAQFRLVLPERFTITLPAYLEYD